VMQLATSLMKASPMVARSSEFEQECVLNAAAQAPQSAKGTAFTAGLVCLSRACGMQG
jgi:hypothetical protein